MLSRLNNIRLWGSGAALLGISLLLSGCHIDMWNQSKMKPYYQSDFFSDGQANRPVVEHSVALGTGRLEDPAYFTGYEGKKAVPKIPVRAVKDFVSTKEFLLRGQERYNAYCSPCHSKVGNGNGFIMQRGLGYWQKLAASYHTDRLRKIEDGYLYDVITNGHGVMYGYASRIQSVDDRWAVVGYVRALQFAYKPPAGAVPPAVQAETERANAAGKAPTQDITGGNPVLNADPNKTGASTPQVSPLGTERPINRTPGGSRQTPVNVPTESVKPTPGASTPAATPRPAAPDTNPSNPATGAPAAGSPADPSANTGASTTVPGGRRP